MEGLSVAGEGGTGGGRFMLEREEEIREQYRQIAKYEAVLVDIGTCAFSDVIATGEKHGLLEAPRVDTPPKEMIDVVRLYRRPLRRPNSEDRIWIRQIGRELDYPLDDLFSRRCVELPNYYEVLYLHRNKWAHRGSQVTVDSLAAFAGAVLGVLELASDEWVDAKDLRDAAGRALAWAADQSREVNWETGGKSEDAGHLRGEIEKLKSQLQQRDERLKERKVESSTTASNTASDIVKGALASAKAHVTKKVSEAREEMEQHLVEIGNAITSLRSEVLERQEYAQSSVDGEDEGDIDQPARTHPRQLTGAQASGRLRDAFLRMRDQGFDTPSNVFQFWIVEEALREAAAGRMNHVDDWWKLPVVQRKTVEEMEQMSQQLEIPNVKDWMMSVYRSVERRSDVP